MFCVKGFGGEGFELSEALANQSEVLRGYAVAYLQGAEEQLRGTHGRLEKPLLVA